MQCRVCKGPGSTSTGMCSNCGTFFHSPVQKIKDTVSSKFLNFLLGSLGLIILCIILFSVITNEMANG